MKNPRIKMLVALLAIITAVQIFTSDAMGQGRRGRGRDRLSKAEVDRVIRNLEEATDEFKRVFDAEVDKTRLDGTSTEDRLWKQVKEFENATDRLRSRFDRTDTWWETRAQVQDVLREARTLNGYVRGYRTTGRMKASWETVRVRINILADTFELPRLR